MRSQLSPSNLADPSWEIPWYAHCSHWASVSIMYAMKLLLGLTWLLGLLGHFWKVTEKDGWGTWARNPQEILGSLSLWQTEDTHVVSYTSRAIREIVATRPEKDLTMTLNQILLKGNHPNDSRKQIKQVKKEGYHPQHMDKHHSTPAFNTIIVNLIKVIKSDHCFCMASCFEQVLKDGLDSPEPGPCGVGLLSEEKMQNHKDHHFSVFNCNIIMIIIIVII